MKKILLISVVLIFMLAFGNVYAESSLTATVDYTDHSIDISGKADASLKHRYVSVQVINPEKNIEDVLSEEDVLNWSDQSKTKSDGSYSFSYNITGDTGVYTVIAGIDGDKTVYKTTFSYYSPAEVDATLSQIKKYVSDEDTEGIKSVISTKYDMLQIDIAKYDALPEENQQLVCKGIIKSSPETVNEFKLMFDQGVQVQKINLVDDTKEYYTEIKNLTYEEYSAVNTIFEGFDSKTQTEILADMMAKDYITAEALSEDFVETVLLLKVNSIRVWGEMEAFLTDVKDIIGIDFTDYNNLDDKSNAIKKMLGETYTSTDDIKKSFDDAVEEAEDDEKDTGSGSSSSGGGSGGGGGYKTAPTTVVPVPDVNSSTEAGTNAFTDLSAAEWARDSILKLCEKNIISGYGDKTFRPNNNVTRAEFLKMTIMLFDIKSDNNAKNKFEDVKNTDWYYEYVNAALSKGIVTGVSETEFNPDGLISRQDMAVILYRAAISAGKAYESGDLSFSDKDSISDYAAESVSAFSKAGIINGYNNMFNPVQTATRAEAAQILYNISQND